MNVMDWLLHNPIGDMRGPVFLVFYAVLSAGILIFSGLTLWTRYWTGALASPSAPPVPAEVDPYELAWLRDGEAEVVRVALLRLIHRGYLQQTGDQVAQATPRPDPRHLGGVELTLFNYVNAPMRPSELLQDRRLLAAVAGHCQPYSERSAQEQWIIPNPRRIFWRVILTGLLSLLVGMAFYKLFVALAKGRTNVGFLLLLLVLNLILFFVIRRSAVGLRLSRRGQDYLGKIKTALAQLQERAATITTSSSDATLALLTGAFGLGVLHDTIYAAYASSLHPPRRSWAGSDGSSGSCGSSCSSGSSCGGGGGCGGGGCGGCGG